MLCGCQQQNNAQRTTWREVNLRSLMSFFMFCSYSIYMLAPTATLLMADSVTLFYGLFIHVCYIYEVSAACHQGGTNKKKPRRAKSFPFS